MLENDTLNAAAGELNIDPKTLKVWLRYAGLTWQDFVDGDDHEDPYLDALSKSGQRFEDEGTLRT